ncbi:hypothetical protein Tco_0466250 [Tanacetum coccineum]
MSGEESTPQMAPIESPHVVSSVKLPILKKGEYTLWSHEGWEQYYINTDYALWQVIMNGDESVKTTKDDNGVETEVPPKTVQAILARQKERKAKSILLLAIPDKYQFRFHTIKDAKSLWAAIKSRFGGNVESKKMQKNEIPNRSSGALFSNGGKKDCQIKKFSKSYTLSWNNIALIMRIKEGIDELNIDNMYNNLKVFEADIKSSSGSSLNSQNVAFLSAEDTNGINEVNTANGVSTAYGHNSQGQASSSTYIDDIMFSFFANQSNSPQLDDEDALIKLRLNALTVIEGGILKGNVELQEIKGIGMEIQGIGAETTPEGLYHYIAQDEPTKFALMSYTSGSNTEALESVEAQLVFFETMEFLYEEKRFTQISSKDKTGLGYGDQLNENDSSGSELFNSMFDSRSSNRDDNQTNDRFKMDSGYHAVPPPLTGNYIPPLADLSFAGLDDSVYRPTTNKTSANVSQVETSITPPSNTSVEMPRVESIWPSGVIIKDWVSDDDEDIF